MTLWRVGPLWIGVAGLSPPADWASAGDEVAGPTADLTVELVDGPAPGPDGAAIAAVTTRRDGDLVTFARSGGFTASLDLVSGHARYQGLVDVGPPGEADAPCPIFESFLRVVTACVLGRRGGALLHGASVALAGRGYAFCGLSGAGKTTLVEGTPAGVYLSDDQTIVSAGDAGFSLWGSPFSGLAARRAAGGPFPLRALVLLSSERGERTEIVPRTDRAAAAAELLRHACFFEGTPAEASRAMAFATEVVSTVPVFSVRRHISTPLPALVAALDERIGALRRSEAA